MSLVLEEHLEAQLPVKFNGDGASCGHVRVSKAKCVRTGLLFSPFGSARFHVGGKEGMWFEVSETQDVHMMSLAVWAFVGSSNVQGFIASFVRWE